MKRIVILALAILTVASLSVAALQSPAEPLTGTGEKRLQGRIVLYDWASHEATTNDDFVLKTVDSKNSSPQYARVIYKPFWSFDAPKATAKDLLDRWAFVGRGASWSFTVHAPQNSEERVACSAPIANHKYEDETGSGEIPRFVPTPGADIEKIPSVQSLPCFILRRDGMARVTSDGGSLKSGAVVLDGSLHLTIPIAAGKPKRPR